MKIGRLDKCSKAPLKSQISSESPRFSPRQQKTKKWIGIKQSKDQSWKNTKQILSLKQKKMLKIFIIKFLFSTVKESLQGGSPLNGTHRPTNLYQSEKQNGVWHFPNKQLARFWLAFVNVWQSQNASKRKEYYNILSFSLRLTLPETCGVWWGGVVIKLFNQWQRLRDWVLLSVFLMGHSRPLFRYFSLFNS